MLTYFIIFMASYCLAAALGYWAGVINGRIAAIGFALTFILIAIAPFIVHAADESCEATRWHASAYEIAANDPALTETEREEAQRKSNVAKHLTWERCPPS